VLISGVPRKENGKGKEKKKTDKMERKKKGGEKTTQKQISAPRFTKKKS